MKSRGRRRGRTSAPGPQLEPSLQAVPPPDPSPAPAPGAAMPADAAVAGGVDRGGTSGGQYWVGRLFIPAGIAILLIAAALRLPELALNPFHHDEGVNGFFTMNLVRTGKYVYDPANYHGPSLYYFALLSEILFGLTTEAMRLVPVVFGILTVGLVLPLRRYLGPVAVLTAAALLAVSPGMIYISRYFIHEMLLVAMTLALVVSAILYVDRRQPRYLLTGAVSLALLFTTKETGIVTIAVLLIAAIVAHLYVGWRAPSSRPSTAGRAAPRRRPVWIDGVEYRPAAAGEGGAGPLAAWSRARIPGEQLVAAAVVFVVIYVLLYSSFFSNFPKGLVDSLATFTIWVQHGETTQAHPIYQYLQWMIQAGVEVPILVLGAIGGLVAAIEGRNRLWVFIGLWAAGITTAYSLIQYKTPWIIVNMLLPLALLAGHAVATAVRTVPGRVIAPIVLAGAVVGSGYLAIDLNYRHYDDETYPYVYVHSTREMLDLVDDIEATAQRAGTGKQTGIVFVTPDYWPLPWYMRDYPRAGFYGKIVPTTEAMIVANVNQEAELAPSIAGKYDKVAEYVLRPGVKLVLYVRSDVPKP